MKIIVGLGNPGSEYEDTRHNIGFMAIEKLAKELSTETVNWQKSEKDNAFLARVGDIILVKPLTFMNDSGKTVARLMHFYKLNPQDIWVIHDDMDLPIGKIRIRERGSSGGHRGVDSIIRELKSNEFVRFRLGIGRGKLIGHGSDDGEEVGKASIHQEQHARHQSVISFVLSRFTQSEAGLLKHLIKNGSDAVRIALNDGVDKAMGRFN